MALAGACNGSAPSGALDAAAVVDAGSDAEDAVEPDVVQCFTGIPEPGAPTVLADQIPVAHTPVHADGTCGWADWPEPVLASCTEPLVTAAPDLRGLWAVAEGLVGHVERIEQCGDRVVITGGGVTHDMRADGSLDNGVHDVNVQTCMELEVAADFVDGQRLELRPFGGTVVAVTREIVGDQLVWSYAGNVSRLERICQLPD